MPNDRQRASYAGFPADAAFRLLVMQKIAHDLTMLFEVEPQLPPELQTLLRKLREQD
jgi:hypothetical protein